VSALTHFTTIEDAYYYFFQANGASDTLDGTAVKQRHLRTAALLGWVAVDDAIAAFAEGRNLVWPRNCKRPALLPRLQFICKELNCATPDEAEFKRHRDVRNSIAHPSGIADASLSVEQVDELLGYCKAAIRDMFPSLVVGEEWKGRLPGAP
jgi:hypothetical protein